MNIKIIDFGYKQLPTRAHYNDAGADVYLKRPEELLPHESKALPLGFGLEIPDGYMGIIQPRSGHAKRGIIAHIPPIDSGYRGEIHAIVTNTTDSYVSLEEDERVGQLVIMPIIIANFVTDSGKFRGDAAFNSTGK
jgi:dUTP pyrophosphatase